MPNNCLSVLYKHIIQVENKNVGLKLGGGGHKHTIAPPNQKSGGAHAPLAPPPRFLRQCKITKSKYNQWRNYGGGGSMDPPFTPWAPI